MRPYSDFIFIHSRLEKEKGTHDTHTRKARQWHGSQLNNVLSFECKEMKRKKIHSLFELWNKNEKKISKLKCKRKQHFPLVLPCLIIIIIIIISDITILFSFCLFVCYNVRYTKQNHSCYPCISLQFFFFFLNKNFRKTNELHIKTNKNR